LLATLRWQRQGFACEAHLTVAALCQTLSARVRADLIDPLCVSALNTPADQASATVFLRVLHDALLGASGSSHLLLPKADLSALLPDAAVRWLAQHGSTLQAGRRVTALAHDGEKWWVNGQPFAAVVLACSAQNSALVLMQSAQTAASSIAKTMTTWAAVAGALRFEAIATVYAWAATAGLRQPMLALRSTPSAPAQFVFDRGQLGGPAGLLAFVVSASQSDRASLQTQVLAQARSQLGLNLQPVQTVLEKRATFACTPALTRPAIHIAPGLAACGDYVAGPYPATLEGAVRSGAAAIDQLGSEHVAALARMIQG
ncbi:MAG: FAD-dependent oxidoreductase, partial [Rhodoferax sp.]|nr:FAD-dependent oxidoreductase [Rhodoferax sp.]